MELKTFSVDDIRKLGPCYDPVTGMDDDGNVIHPGGFVPENWTGTALDILKIDACPADDRLWVVLRRGWIDDRTLRLFAVWCAREAQKLVDEPDPRSIAACDVAERFALGAATSQELNAAWSAAEAVAMDAADAAWDAVWAAAEAAARDAAWAAWTTARDAARASAEAAAEAAARTARAAWAARDAAWDAARESQIKHLITMLEADDRKS